MKQLSLLLGAGFSVNQGYPTAKQLNTKILSLSIEDFFISSVGQVIFWNEENKKINYVRYKWIYENFIVEFIQFYCILNQFDYENFYDYYHNLIFNNDKDERFLNFCQEFRKKWNCNDSNSDLLYNHDRAFNQIVAALLVDKDGKQFYHLAHACKPSFPGYTGFLYCLEDWGKSNDVVHIHSLNHDLFFEIFKSSDWIQGNLSDGFEELGSPYYGKLGETYNVRLSYFVNKFKDKFRLYKLHGSIDQYAFHEQNDAGIDKYFKTKKGIDTTSFLKEVKVNGNLQYKDDWINYHPDFLSGTSSKILRYREPFYYGKLFKHFEKNLLNSNTLVMIGYSCRDEEINKIIKKKFKGDKVFLIDPYPSKEAEQFCSLINGVIIQKKPGDINLKDFTNS